MKPAELPRITREELAAVRTAAARELRAQTAAIIVPCVVCHSRVKGALAGYRAVHARCEE